MFDSQKNEALSAASGQGLFPPTQWSVVLNARDGSGAACEAMERLARAYWRPLYAYARGAGRGHEDAADVVQVFFESLLTRDSLRVVQPGETRFRSYLVRCLKNWIASGVRRELAEKRGGGVAAVPLHELASAIVPALPDAASPEEAMDRVWAQEVFERSFARLAEDAAQRGRGEVFEKLRPVLLGAQVGFAELGASLAVGEGTARKMVFDLRARLGQFLREEVLATVASPEEAEAELRYLLGLL